MFCFFRGLDCCVIKGYDVYNILECKGWKSNFNLIVLVYDYFYKILFNGIEYLI